MNEIERRRVWAMVVAASHAYVAVARYLPPAHEDTLRALRDTALDCKRLCENAAGPGELQPDLLGDLAPRQPQASPRRAPVRRGVA